MAAADSLRELATFPGFSGAALFTAGGELLAAHGADPQLETAGALARSLLRSAHRASQGMGTGRGREVHVAGDRAHVLVRCLEGTDPRGPDPGGAHPHLVVVLAPGASLALARLRIAATLQRIADELRA